VTIFGVWARTLPSFVVPAFVGTFTHGEEICPSSVVIRSLEFSVIGIDSLVSNISKEPFDLSHHSDVAYFVRETDRASSSDLWAFNWLSDKYTVTWYRIVL
jgi:hypothetical protein